MSTASGATRRMLVICPFPVGVAAGQRLKYEQYFSDWEEIGIEISVSPFMDKATWDVAFKKGHHGKKIVGLVKGHLRRVRDLFRVGRFDLIYVHMWVTPLGSVILERLVRALARKLIYDIEDNVLIGQPSAPMEHPNPIVRILKSPNKARFLVGHSDHVITSSPFLNDFCLELNKYESCTYISSSVDTSRFLPANSYSNDRKVTIGWTGTFSSRPYLDLLREMLQKLAARRAYTLKVIGNFEYSLPGVDLEVVQWSKEREISDLQSFDIGIYPLPIDDWVLGKSGLKAIQYMAFGLPIVATAVGTTPMLIQDRENGILVKTQDEWLSALEELIDDPCLRQRLGEAARVAAVTNYSVKAIAHQYRDVLSSVLHGS